MSSSGVIDPGATSKPVDEPVEGKEVILSELNIFSVVQAFGDECESFSRSGWMTLKDGTTYTYGAKVTLPAEPSDEAPSTADGESESASADEPPAPDENS